MNKEFPLNKFKEVKPLGTKDGIIFDIQSFSVHDGPGIRTLFFFKGCPLRCKWCSNPESQKFQPQLIYKKNLCHSECKKCPSKDKMSNNAGKKILDIEFIPNCPNKAAIICGEKMQVEEIMLRVQKDRPYFGSTGGITLSGGEPYHQPDFTLAILKKCKKSGVSTAIETSLHAPFSIIENSLPYIDFFMFDIKIMDSKRHKEYCGVDNQLILANIQGLTRVAEIPLLPRMPVIPGINDDEMNIRKTAEFLSNNGLKYIHLLPYMRMGILKYEQLGLSYELPNVKIPTEEQMNLVKRIFSLGNIVCV